MSVYNNLYIFFNAATINKLFYCAADLLYVHEPLTSVIVNRVVLGVTRASLWEQHQLRGGALAGHRERSGGGVGACSHQQPDAARP